jgi:hypothetical protein
VGLNIYIYIGWLAVMGGIGSSFTRMPSSNNIGTEQFLGGFVISIRIQCIKNKSIILKKIKK